MTALAPARVPARPAEGGAEAAGPRVRVAYFVASMQVGGTEMNALRTAERLDRSRFDVVVGSFGGDGPLLARYRAAGIRVVQFPLESLYDRTAIAQGLRLYRFLREETIDVVHCHDMYSNVFATPWSRLARVPVVIASRRWMHPVDDSRLEFANRIAYRIAHRVLGNSRAVTRLLHEGDGVGQRRILHLPNFVEERAFDSPGRPTLDAFAAQIGLPPDALVVGCIARLVPVKDHASLLRAIAELVPRWPGLRLVLVGDGPCRPSLEALASELGIAKRTHFAGHRPNHPNLNALFDVAVLASTSEGFPNSLVEALAAGCPLVATDVGGNRDAVRPGTGILVPASAPAALAAGIEQVLGNPVLRKAMSEEARKVASTDYHVDAVIPQLQGMYLELLGRRAPVGRR